MTSLINFYEEMTVLVDEGIVVSIVCLAFSKAFDTATYKILTENLLMYGLAEQTVRWIENRLNARTGG